MGNKVCKCVQKKQNRRKNRRQSRKNKTLADGTVVKDAEEDIQQPGTITGTVHEVAKSLQEDQVTSIIPAEATEKIEVTPGTGVQAPAGMVDKVPGTVVKVLGKIVKDRATRARVHNAPGTIVQRQVSPPKIIGLVVEIKIPLTATTPQQVATVQEMKETIQDELKQLDNWDKEAAREADLPLSIIPISIETKAEQSVESLKGVSETASTSTVVVVLSPVTSQTEVKELIPEILQKFSKESISETEVSKLALAYQEPSLDVSVEPEEDEPKLSSSHPEHELKETSPEPEVDEESYPHPEPEEDVSKESKADEPKEPLPHQELEEVKPKESSPKVEPEEDQPEESSPHLEPEADELKESSPETEVDEESYPHPEPEEDVSKESEADEPKESLPHQELEEVERKQSSPKMDPP